MFERLKEKYREQGRNQVLNELQNSQRWFSRYPKIHNFIERFVSSYKLYGSFDNQKERECIEHWDNKLMQ